MKTLLLIALQLGASGADAFYTHRAMELRPRYEANPIARQFVTTTPGQVVFFAGGAALHIGAAHLLRKHHPILADGVLIEGTAEGTFGAAYTAEHTK